MKARVAKWYKLVYQTFKCAFPILIAIEALAHGFKPWQHNLTRLVPLGEGEYGVPHRLFWLVILSPERNEAGETWLNEIEKDLAARKVANYIIDHLMSEPITPAELESISLHVTLDTIATYYREIKSIAHLAVTQVSNDSRVVTTRTQGSNSVLYKRKD